LMDPMGILFVPHLEAPSCQILKNLKIVDSL